MKDKAVNTLIKMVDTLGSKSLPKLVKAEPTTFNMRGFNNMQPTCNKSRRVTAQVGGGGVYREEEEAESEGEPVNMRQGDEEEVEMTVCDRRRGCKDAKRSDFTLISNHPRFNCDSCWL